MLYKHFHLDLIKFKYNKNNYLCKYYKNMDRVCRYYFPNNNFHGRFCSYSLKFHCMSYRFCDIICIPFHVLRSHLYKYKNLQVLFSIYFHHMLNKNFLKLRKLNNCKDIVRIYLIFQNNHFYKYRSFLPIF